MSTSLTTRDNHGGEISLFLKEKPHQPVFDYILSHFLSVPWYLCTINYSKHDDICFFPTVRSRLLINSSYSIKKKLYQLYSPTTFPFSLFPLSFTTSSLREAYLLPSLQLKDPFIVLSVCCLTSVPTALLKLHPSMVTHSHLPTFSLWLP